MLVSELIGKKITNIYLVYEPEVGGLDKAECFVELDNNAIIDIPFGFSDEIWIKELSKHAVSVFADLSDYPVYHVNKAGKSIGEIAANYQKRKSNFFNKALKFLFNHDIKIKEYQPYKIEHKENKLKYIKDKTIIDFIWYPDDSEKGFLFLDNGYIITETTVSNHGTGLAGLNFFESLDELKSSKGNNYKKLTMLKQSEL